MPNKGCRKDLQNYRLINLLSMLYKTFTKILIAKLKKQLNNEQPSKQAGFRCQFSTINHIHSLCQIMEKARECNQQPVHLGSVDFEKSFNSIESKAVANTLAYQGINKWY